MKLYTTRELREHLNWMGHEKIAPFLLSHGIKPTQEVKTSKRTYRMYDKAALTKAKELRAERERELNPPPVLAPVAAPSSAPTVDYGPALDRIWQELTVLRKQMDFLIKELGGSADVPRFDDAGAGGTD